MQTHGQSSVRLRQDAVMRPPDVQTALARLVNSAAFAGVVLAVILANAVVLGLQT